MKPELLHAFVLAVGIPFLIGFGYILFGMIRSGGGFSARPSFPRPPIHLDLDEE